MHIQGSLGDRKEESREEGLVLLFGEKEIRRKIIREREREWWIINQNVRSILLSTLPSILANEWHTQHNIAPGESRCYKKTKKVKKDISMAHTRLYKGNTRFTKTET